MGKFGSFAVRKHPLEDFITIFSIRVGLRIDEIYEVIQEIFPDKVNANDDNLTVVKDYDDGGGSATKNKKQISNIEELNSYLATFVEIYKNDLIPT